MYYYYLLLFILIIIIIIIFFRASSPVAPGETLTSSAVVSPAALSPAAPRGLSRGSGQQHGHLRQVILHHF